MMKTNLLKMVAGGLISAFGYLFGGLDMLLQTLLILIGIDILTGWVSGAYLGQLSSKTSFKGILKKITILCMVVLGYRLDMLGMENIVQGIVGFDINNPARTMIIMFYLGNEGLSIVENVGKVIELPSWLKKLFETMKDRGEK